MTKDLTTGKPFPLILGFIVPLIFGNLFQQAYSMVDTMIVGQFLGTDALAAVGLTGPVTFLVLGLCMGVANGFAIPVAQQFGSKDFSALRKYVGNIIWLVLFISAAITLVTVLLCKQILIWTNTPENILDASYAYLIIIFAGIPILVIYNTLAGILRSLGDSKTPVIFLVIASVLNIVLDLGFITIFNMGVAGAALATVISQGVSAIGCFIVILKNFPILRITKDDMKLRKLYVKRLLAMGLPMGLQFSITAIGSVILQTSVNTLGSVYVAALTAGARLSGLFTCVGEAFGSTMATYAGQNMGAGKIKRIKQGLTSVIIMNVVYSAFAFAICFLFGRSMLTLFIDTAEAQVLDLAYQFIVINSSFFLFVGFVNTFRLMIQGLGYGKIAIFAGLLEMLGRGIVGAFLVPNLGFMAACFGNGSAWIFADLFLIPAAILILRRLSQSIPDTDDVNIV